MSTHDDQKLGHFLRSNAPEVPPESPHLEERILNVTVRSSQKKSLIFLTFTRPQKAFGGAAVAAAAAIFAIILMPPQKHNIPKTTQYTPTAAATINAISAITPTTTADSELDSELNSFLLESINGIETEHALALNSESVLF
jgi:hypothetical protein